VELNRLGIHTAMEGTVESMPVLRSGALFVDAMLQEDLSLNADYDLRGNRAGRPVLSFPQ
jgi:hypothetical protein